MNSKLATAFFVLLFSLAAGAALALFSMFDTVLRYAFSLLAIFIGFQFFKKYETIGLRIVFIILGLLCYFSIMLSYNLYIAISENPELFMQE